MVAQLAKLGFDVAVESGAGAESSFSDEAYRDAGCEVVDSADDLWTKSDIVLKVRAPESDEAARLRALGEAGTEPATAEERERLEELRSLGYIQ